MTAAALLDRASAALWGLAIGDALGMPTQSLSRADIAARWGLLPGFVAGPADQPIAPGRRAGSVTDDTEQAVLLAQALIAGGGRLDPVHFAGELADWEDRMRARGSSDLLGPSTRRAVAAVRAGVPVTETGRDGVTNGAAMRITPVGIAVHTAIRPAAPELAALVAAVEAASTVTHATSPALAAAAAVAAAVSVGVSGATVAEAIDAAGPAARLAATRGRWVAAADVATRIADAAAIAAGADSPAQALDRLYRSVGTGLAAQESVPAAFGVLALTPHDPWLACRQAASLGGDTDTMAAIVGAVAGACHGMAGFPAEARDTVRRVNGLDLDALAAELLAFRRPPA